ncbi:M60 family metallopeptidase [Listeria sp. PSOL-1]|uniref:M60 family metallopeptidase n=1 Tax=Listeria sp. PSOL-1 TaxID=1844999 RepID=UPI0018D6B788|nr:M60 family metallopeptidase [Listeria sp. PSOL-1]
MKGEQANSKQEKILSTEKIQKTAQKQMTKEFIGRGNTETERDRQRRSLRYSSLDPSGLYAEQGDTLTVEVSRQDSLELTIGTPERNLQKKYALNQGKNMIKVENQGAIYIKNPNENGSASVTISGATGSMPYFDLNQTSVKEFQRQLSMEVNVTDVQLVSNKAIITVSYQQAKKKINNPKELMEYYDKFLLAQDRVSGINDNGRKEDSVDRHFQHFVEVSRMYMFATQEYMGFNGDAALSRLLKTNNGWGIWHESGHQRQQSPWKWSSVTESTVNIYSMAAQKEITGAITALDKYYPQMHNFLKSENKDFEKQNNDLKMVLFGQLANTFGEDFYPILHQYYRENKLPYGTDSERIQNFMLTVSNITGYNMVPYFEQWGFRIADATREQTSQLLDLPEPIWLNDNQINRQLPMRLINTVTLSETGVNVDLTAFENDIFKGQKVVLIKNGQYISELTNKKPYYSSLNKNVWKTKVSLAPTDKIQIETRNSTGTFQLYQGSITIDQLKTQILNTLNSKDDLSSVMTQAILDHIRSEIAEITDKNNKQTLLDLLEKLETRYLQSLVKDIRLDAKGTLSVEFVNNKFKEYNKIVILGSNRYIAEIAKGKPYYSSLSGNVLTVHKEENKENFAVQFRLPHKTYTVSDINKAELVLKRDIDDLFIGSNQLKANVTQEKLDDLRTKTSLLSGDLRDQLTTKMKDAQQLFFEAMVSELMFDDKVMVTFSSELYKNYKLVVLENKKYMAEVTKGKPYYGQLKGTTFSTTKKAIPGSLYEIEVRHASGNYRIKARTFD